MPASTLSAILHTVVALGLLTAYVVLWALGHQDNALLGILGGQLGALGVTQVALNASTDTNPPPKVTTTSATSGTTGTPAT